LTITDERTLISAEMCVMNTARCTLLDCERNEEIMAELRTPQITEFI
jgi:hypothetical protein